MVQLSILKIIGYGPWTLTLGSDREHELQMLQASLYGEVQRLFSERGCLVFQNRADELFVVSNGLDLDEHARIQEELISRFDVRLRILIGDGDTPGTAHEAASSAGASNLDAGNRIFAPANLGGRVGHVDIMHMDVDGLSGMTLQPYDTTMLMFGLYGEMSRFFYERDSLAFFMGGDNFMVVASEAGKAASREFVDKIECEYKVILNCGIGSGKTGREAAKLATMSLDAIRTMRDSGDEGRASADRSRIYECATGARL